METNTITARPNGAKFLTSYDARCAALLNSTLRMRCWRVLCSALLHHCSISLNVMSSVLWACIRIFSCWMKYHYMQVEIHFAGLLERKFQDGHQNLGRPLRCFFSVVQILKSSVNDSRLPNHFLQFRQQRHLVTKSAAANTSSVRWTRSWCGPRMSEERSYRRSQTCTTRTSAKFSVGWKTNMPVIFQIHKGFSKEEQILQSVTALQVQSGKKCQMLRNNLTTKSKLAWVNNIWRNILIININLDQSVHVLWTGRSFGYQNTRLVANHREPLLDNM